MEGRNLFFIHDENVCQVLEGGEVESWEIRARGSVGGDGKPDVDVHATMVCSESAMARRCGALKGGEVSGDFRKGVGSG